MITLGERLSLEMAQLTVIVLQLKDDVARLRDEVACLQSSMQGCAFFGANLEDGHDTA